MAAADDFDEVFEQYHLALDEIMKGSADGYKKVYSRRDDVTLANPFGPPARGWAKVEGRGDVTPIAVRVTTIFRPEEGTWKVVHRHADPITTAQPAESVIQE